MADLKKIKNITTKTEGFLINYCLAKRECDVIGSKLVTGFDNKISVSARTFINAEKSLFGHVKKPITSSFFNTITIHLAARCRTFISENKSVKFQYKIPNSC